MKSLAPHPLFDALIQERGLKNDAELARFLEVQPPFLSKMRNRKADLNDTVRVSIMRKFRWTLKRVDELAPPGGLEGDAAGAVQ